ncbi:flagellar operon protein, putative [Solidesulfovibrio carbinoliphilus subsp. oakridgensis]|uniref:Flagellar operon protein, putative n=1 Tax=Solidesulfovibrio carbinoliphilus subsp. oakridgensis TaxID=694327 RepID=G7QC91_9BACT|nr:DUF4258 domain-containing protein [Solidesulfovibrio carbinoliphilus]EHJ49537.1 flagellar operon protein, putative [Solidesulfovibrio carbinoliphilus subsp. oakridgensis]
MSLRYTDHAIKRMNQRNISLHLAEIAVVCGKKTHMDHKTVRYAWNGFCFVVNTQSLTVVTAYDVTDRHDENNISPA